MTSSIPTVSKKKISHRSNQNNTTTNPSVPEIVRGENQKLPWHNGRVQDKRSRGPQFKPQCGQKDNLSQVQSEQYHHQSLCTRVKYLKLSEVKTRSSHVHSGRVQHKRTRGPQFKPQCGQKETSGFHLSQVQSEQYHHQSLCTTVKYLKLSEVKTRSCHGAVVESRTRDPEVPSSNPCVAKKKISYRSNQNNTTTNTSAPELNT